MYFKKFIVALSTTRGGWAVLHFSEEGGSASNPYTYAYLNFTPSIYDDDDYINDIIDETIDIFEENGFDASRDYECSTDFPLIEVRFP